MKPKIRFKRDGDRYIVFFGDDRLGFVKSAGRVWNAVDTYMAWSRDFPNRTKAAEALKRHWERRGRP